MTKEDNKILNEKAIDLMIKTFGHEHPGVIWFCREIEKNPYVGLTERTKLILKACGCDDDEDEE